MNEFLKLNRHKIIFGLKWSSIVFTTLVLALFIWALFREEMPEWPLALTVLFTASVVFPFVTVTLGTFQEFQVYRRARKIFDTFPFSELTKVGFENGFVNESSNWMMTQVVLKGHFNEYPMEAEIENSVFKLIAFVNLDRVTKDHVKQLKRDLGKKRIEMDWLGIALRYDTSKERLTSFDQIKYDLNRLTDYLNREQLRPEVESSDALQNDSATEK